MSTLPTQDSMQQVRVKQRPPHFAAAAAAQFKKELETEQTTIQQKDNIETKDNQAIQSNSATQNIAAPLSPSYIDSLAITNLDKVQPQHTYSIPEQQKEIQKEPQYNEDYVRVTEENNKLKKELDEIKERFEQAKKLENELLSIKEEKDIEELLNNAGLDLASIDINDAKRLLKPIITATRTQLNEYEKRLADYKNKSDSRLDEVVLSLKEQKRLETLENTKHKILKAHPDLEEFQKSSRYHDAMMSPVDGKTGMLTYQLVQSEYHNGNADYIIELLNRIKNTQASTENIAAVNPSGTGTIPAKSPELSEGFLTPEDIARLRFELQSGKIDRKEFNSLMEKHREAKKTQNN